MPCVVRARRIRGRVEESGKRCVLRASTAPRPFWRRTMVVEGVILDAKEVRADSVWCAFVVTMRWVIFVLAGRLAGW